MEGVSLPELAAIPRDKANFTGGEFKIRFPHQGSIAKYPEGLVPEDVFLHGSGWVARHHTSKNRHNEQIGRAHV